MVTDALSDFLFVTEPSGVTNLRMEGVPEGRIHLVGNVMIDTLVRLRDRAIRSQIVERLDLSNAAYALATFHRPSNVDTRGRAVRLVRLIQAVAERLPLVFPVHPRTRERLASFSLWPDLEATPSVRLLEPQGYLEFLCLMERAAVVLTDSGGIQEETTYLGTPCLTLRENTERPITVTHGTNRLVSMDREAVIAEIDRAMMGRAPDRPPLPLWDGRAAERIVDLLLC